MIMKKPKVQRAWYRQASQNIELRLVIASTLNAATTPNFPTGLPLTHVKICLSRHRELSSF